MPCDSITTQSVNLSNAMAPLLADALRQSGYTVNLEQPDRINAYGNGAYIVWAKGVGLDIDARTSQAGQDTVQTITQAYSARAVTWAAGRAGWTVKAINTNTFQVTRR